MTDMYDLKNIKIDLKNKRHIKKIMKAKKLKIISTKPKKQRHFKVICGTDKKGRLVIERIVVLWQNTTNG